MEANNHDPENKNDSDDSELLELENEAEYYQVKIAKYKSMMESIKSDAKKALDNKKKHHAVALVKIKKFLNPELEYFKSKYKDVADELRVRKIQNKRAQLERIGFSPEAAERRIQMRLENRSNDSDDSDEKLK